ncbi:nucleotide exchange factor GrpE [Candidatus Saccharibacteria bacterium]|nr:nucleotide exchange factor GrpE [Candidatus Saccharibacteria bacterium]
MTKAKESVSKKAASIAIIEDLQSQINQLTEALQRERADSDNIRRRHEEQINSVREHVKVQVIIELLPVIDNFERALKHIPKDLEGNDYVRGVQGVVKQFEDTLGQMGVERIKAVGEKFDPQLHEAVQTEEGDGKDEVVSEELQSGYRLGNNVIRHAMVKVRQ